MDGQNFGNGQNNGYQDNTANVPYQSSYNPNGKGNGSGKANGLQIAGLVLGIIAICLICCYGLPSLILGIIGLVCALKGNKENKHGVGIAGLVCSIIGIIGGLCSFIYYIVIVGVLFSGGYFDEIMRSYY